MKQQSNLPEIPDSSPAAAGSARCPATPAEPCSEPTGPARALALSPSSAFFAAPHDKWQDGWWGPAATREAAIRDMLSSWDDEPLKSCVTAAGALITPETHPDLYDNDGDCISEWDYQVEKPYVVHALPLPND